MVSDELGDVETVDADPRPTAVAAAQDALERLRRIESVTDVALSRLTMEELLDELLLRLRDLLTADTAAVLLLDDSGEFLTPVAAEGLEEEVRQGVRIPVGRGFAGAVAAQAAPLAILEVNPSNVVNRILIRKHIKSMLGVPLLDADTVIGVLHVGTLSTREFSDDDVAVLQLAADRVAGAITVRRTYVDRAAAVALQRSLAPRRLPGVPGFHFAARYVPGSQFGVSGDWYDVFALPGDRIGIVIGDVMGHGLRAATMMGRIKSALRAYALDYDDPAAVVQHLDRKLNHFEPGQTATLVYATLEPTNGTVWYSSAGHLPIALASEDGTVDLLSQPGGLPLGVDLAPTRPASRVTVEPGALLCLLTDGLIDHRRTSIDDGLDTVCATLRSLNPAADRAEAACVSLMECLVGERQPDDDVTILAVNRDSLPTHSNSGRS